jgi:glycosyltransferase involved in cell wall biosynthesis
MIMISVLMRHASFGLLPYMPTIDFANSIPNKAIEYLSHGLPVVTSLTHGILHDILVENECGLFYKAKEPRGLASVLSAALGQTCDRDRMSNNAKTLYESKFRADQCTHSMAEYLVDLGSRH